MMSIRERDDKGYVGWSQGDREGSPLQWYEGYAGRQGEHLKVGNPGERCQGYVSKTLYVTRFFKACDILLNDASGKKGSTRKVIDELVLVCHSSQREDESHADS
jgi:hypothetical protein